MSGRVDQWWTVGPYRFEELVEHPFNKISSGPMYRFAIDGKISSEVFESLDRAMVAAVGERAMGPRGAAGNAVGTAADWFCVMIGLDEAEAVVPTDAPEACSGSGRGWLASSEDDARCSVCMVSSQDLGLPRPARRGLGYAGLVPPHIPAGKALP